MNNGQTESNPGTDPRTSLRTRPPGDQPVETGELDVTHPLKQRLSGDEPDDRWDAVQGRYYLADRARLLADGGGCEMQRLGELPCDECAGNRAAVYQFVNATAVNLRDSHQSRLLLCCEIRERMQRDRSRVRGVATARLEGGLVLGDRAVPQRRARAPLPGSAQSGRHHENP